MVWIVLNVIFRFDSILSQVLDFSRSWANCLSLCINQKSTFLAHLAFHNCTQVPTRSRLFKVIATIIDSSLLLQHTSLFLFAWFTCRPFVTIHCLPYLRHYHVISANVFLSVSNLPLYQLFVLFPSTSSKANGLITIILSSPCALYRTRYCFCRIQDYNVRCSLIPSVVEIPSPCFRFCLTLPADLEEAERGINYNYCTIFRAHKYYSSFLKGTSFK